MVQLLVLHKGTHELALRIFFSYGHFPCHVKGLAVVGAMFGLGSVTPGTLGCVFVFPPEG